MTVDSSSEVFGAEFFVDPSDAEQFVTKAGAFRALLDVLRHEGVFERVVENADPAAHELMRNPPLPITWMPAVAFQYLFRAMWAVLGPDEFRRVARASVLSGPMKVMRPIIEGTLRLFGASPAAFFRRLPKIMASQLEGIEFEVVELRETTANIEVAYPLLRDVAEPAFVYWEAVLANTFDICGCKGSARTERVDSSLQNRARIILDWQA